MFLANGIVTAAQAGLVSLVSFLPALIAAILIMTAGWFVAGALGNLVTTLLRRAGFDSPSLVGSVAQYAIVGFAVIVAVEQIGIATTLVNMLFAALVGALALAFGLAFGLGGREVAGQVWRNWYARAQDLAPQLEAAARPALHDTAQPSPSAPAYASAPMGGQAGQADGESRLRQPGEGWRSDH